MNPYDPPLASSASVERSGIDTASAPQRIVFVVTTAIKAVCFGAFVFFGLLESLGVFVNWPNVVPILVGSAFVLTGLHATRKRLLHGSFTVWPMSSTAYFAGGLLGIAASACAMAGWI
jgi:hypothetical protein